MSEEYLTYYINENEDVVNFLHSESIHLSESAIDQVAFISKKTANNYIGYYQFKTDDKYVKFFIVPKIHRDIPNEAKEENFFKFFSKYYELSDRYAEIKKEPLNGNIIDLTFKDFKEKNSHKIDDFIRYKYMFALNILDRFFRKHNKTRYIYTSYHSQSIENKIDLKRNILNIDKSLVFQIKKEIESYSKIALIAHKSLNRFKKEKLTLFEKDSEILIQKTDSIINTINKKYKTNQGFIFNDRDIITNRIVKLFKKNNELKEVFEALLVIIGLEHFKSEDYSSEIRKLPNMVALFFNPSDLYEWVVYDHLKSNYPDAAIFKDGIDKDASEEYFLVTHKARFSRSSEPDFIILENELITIIDAKWKILDRITDILSDDVLKIERDYTIRKHKYGGRIQAQLVYPKIKFDPGEYNPLSQSFSPKFEFDIKEVKVE